MQKPLLRKGLQAALRQAYEKLEELQAQAETIKAQVAKDLGVEESAVQVGVSDKGHVSVSAPRAVDGQKVSAASKIAEAVRTELATNLQKLFRGRRTRAPRAAGRAPRVRTRPARPPSA